MLSFRDLIMLTSKSLLGNPLRSGLTTLGVFMGVFAVSSTLQVGDISTLMIEQELAKKEAPQVKFNLYSAEGRQPKAQDLEYLRQRLNRWKTIGAKGFSSFESIRFENAEQESSIVNVTPDYLTTSGRGMLRGRFLTPPDFTSYRSVVVIDRLLWEKLFKSGPIAQKDVFFLNRLWRVVGVIETKAEYSGGEPRGFAIIPMSTFSSLTGTEGIDQILVSPQSVTDIDQIKTTGENLLKKRFPDAEVWSYSNIDTILELKQIWTLASRGLLAVGGISLLIGGIGITNITVAAVVERTSEIGLRRAIGATRREILLQFILEALLLSLFGGVSAIVIVHGITTGVSSTFDLPYTFNPRTAALALGSAIGVGVGACFLPALRASRLDPVLALRAG
jgi:putative ABC transport system permease protein